jgi:hypothetical protein
MGKSGKKMTIKETEGEVIETEKLIPSCSGCQVRRVDGVET